MTYISTDWPGHFIKKGKVLKQLLKGSECISSAGWVPDLLHLLVQRPVFLVNELHSVTMTACVELNGLCHYGHEVHVGQQ